MNSEEGQPKHQFFHNSVNITEWMKTKVSGILQEKGYTILLMDINTETMARMSKLSIINTIKLKFKDAQENVYALNNYTSLNKDYEEEENVRWLIDYIKELEMEAILKFGSDTLETKAPRNYVPQNVVVGNATIKKTDNFTFDIYMNASVSDMARFLTRPDFICRWAPGAIIKGTEIEYENLVLRNIRANKSSIEMEYKWVDWDEFSQVCIQLTQAGDCVKVTVKHIGVPVALVDNVKSHWRSRIFPAISGAFNCAIKPTY